jgi:DNA invertase Pin-like site-specific DNA recombinase
VSVGDDVLDYATQRQDLVIRAAPLLSGAWPDDDRVVDTGISGAKERRPALDRLMTDARQRRVDAIVVAP